MGLHDDGLDYIAGVVTRFVEPCCNDQIGFDWHTRGYMIQAVATKNALCAGCPRRGTRFHKMAHIMSHSVLLTSDGVILAQLFTSPGVVPSGSYITSALQSGNRTLAELVVCPGPITEDTDPAAKVIAMGDDALEEGAFFTSAEHLISCYAAWGYDVKPSSLGGPAFGAPLSFCSYDFGLDGSYSRPDPSKTMAKFFMTWPQSQFMEERMEGLRFELRHTPQRVRLLALVEAVSFALEEEASNKTC